MEQIDVVPARLMTTASADVAMKGLAFLLEALAKLRTDDPRVHLVVIGKPKYDSRATGLIEELDLSDSVEFVSGVSDQRIVEMYNQAEVAVVPSSTKVSLCPLLRQCLVGCPSSRPPGGHYPKW
jgi:glycosyltransferase involved in cell wall biosynthesis